MTRTLQNQSLSQLMAAPRLPLVAALAIGFARVVTTWDTRHRTRNSLKHLDNHLLEDIGVTPAQAYKEATRPFWLG